jgi:ATPase subunit of ABC transporter with duplicated ATPase domains
LLTALKEADNRSTSRLNALVEPTFAKRLAFPNGAVQIQISGTGIVGERLAEDTRPRIRITSAQVSDGTTLNFAGGEVVVFVGRNNAGKSAALRNIDALLRSSKHFTEVVKAIELNAAGSEDDLLSWIVQTSTEEILQATRTHYKRLGQQVELPAAKNHWSSVKEHRNTSLGELAGFLLLFNDRNSAWSI